jgi:hypothetical protein
VTTLSVLKVAVFDIWVRPRATINSILQDTKNTRSEPEYTSPVVLGIVFLRGVIAVVARVASRVFVDRPKPFGLGWTGGLVAVAALFLWGGISTWTGRWLSGQGKAWEIRTAIGWAQIPLILAGAIQTLSAFGGVTKPVPMNESTVFSALRSGLRPADNPLPLDALLGLLLVWHLVITSKCIGEAHRFSAWRGLCCYIFATLLIAFSCAAIVGGAVALTLWKEAMN